MRQFFQAAVENIYRHGDTDVFPFPIENRIIYDKKDAFIDYIDVLYKDIETAFVQNPSDDIRSLIAVHHTGFRWATQLDPVWNAIFLGCVLSIAEQIENHRLGTEFVFSYRLDRGSFLYGDLFRRDVSWQSFIDRSVRLSSSYEYIVTTDIADCYSRIGHHKLDNALRLVGAPPNISRFIIEYLGYLTGTRSSGLPIGGPAARILSEISLNNADQFLFTAGVKFLRYADDYHIFCRSKKDAHDIIVRLHKVLDNEGLTLQKSKTRVLSLSEFKNVLSTARGQEADTRSPIQRLMALALRYDPYAPNAADQYEELKRQLDDIDILALLNEQLARTRIHIPSARKIIEALRIVEPSVQGGAVLSMLDNLSALYPISTTVFHTIYSIFESLDESVKHLVCDKIIDLYDSCHEAMGIENHIAFANRIIGKLDTVNTRSYLHRCFDREPSELIRRDIILIFSNWGNFAWLSIFKANFQAISGWQRRALILASYSMRDEGKHWRDHMKSRFDPFEVLVRDWRTERLNGPLPI
jgi:Fe2+ or Zn2+ uptake regulation protein